MNRDPQHILFGATSSANPSLFQAQLRDLQDHGWTCTTLASPQEPADLWRTLRALGRACPAVTNVEGPPARLALGLASAFTGVPLRVYTQHGLGTYGATGVRGALLALARWVSRAAAHRVVIVDDAPADRVRAPGLTRSPEVAVVGTPDVQSWHRFYLDAMYEQKRGQRSPVLRSLDILGAMGGGVVVALPALLVALMVRRRLGSPVLFRQSRPGRDGIPFTLLKFRTMTHATQASGAALTDAERLTPFGELLRRTSLDELPSLWNIAKGEMSLVGPRPLLVRYTPYFTDRERLRLAVRPGLTGWAQTNGRNTSSWDERLGNDVWYVVNRSLWLNLRILGRTVRRVVSGTGVVTDAESVMQNLDDERAGGPET